ncbi:SDR family NAD(P)-dependent oxidoreductase [Bacillus sp. FJAT-27251]|uniref:SDR family NAD(P)-dependent oxidoreductase n=1 Tax=Bacillus sp. FJAT-27251 TaxID=1684142 RepID=UPI0012E31EEB|nr:SDR family NAD(P)-dependent oxidoreductase [Bacillus sp. FJAT-27251]
MSPAVKPVFEAFIERIGISFARIYILVAMIRLLWLPEVEKFGKLDILVNNAWYAGPSDPAEQFNSEEFDKIYKVNAYGTFYMVKHAVTHMKENKGGSIINVASNSILTRTDYPGYASSKGAVRTMSYTFANILAKDKIRVNTKIPGTTRTN